MNDRLDDSHIALDSSVCSSENGDVVLFKFDPERNIYYFAQQKALHVLDAKTCSELWSTQLPSSIPDWCNELQFNVKNGVLLSHYQGIMLRVPDTRPEQPIETECLFTQFFNSAQCFVDDN